MRFYNDELDSILKVRQRTWLITGVAGFIGSNLLERLLVTGQRVVGLDNFSTGQQSNLDDVKSNIAEHQWMNFNLIKGDIRCFEDCCKSLEGVDHVLHHAALGSVPRSLKKPLETHEVNVTGFLNVLLASKDTDVKSFIYASSSSVYGDAEGAEKYESIVGNQLSPYAVTKRANELYAEALSSQCKHKIIGLRYFNVFGPRQSTEGEYSAVIPRWISLMMSRKNIVIHGDGETSRDFCYVENVVQANILASISNEFVKSRIFNVAMNARTSLNELYLIIKAHLGFYGVSYDLIPTKIAFREGDIRHSLADIERIKSELNFIPRVSVDTGLQSTVNWYIKNLNT
ncbi:NAD-dependent epimerase/dehydratase family protein [Pseudomonas sp. Z5-35]|uniref:NAD-dependent epimerase/dehydratase family protein n=1 Tax=unclassified Pseudomonas TaxID=196821 RepID=UPI003DA8B3CB